MNNITFSPSTIGLMLSCPKCFWLHMNKKHKRPAGIFPSLPGGMDLVIKDYFDNYRGSLPPEIIGHVRGVLFEDMEKLKKWRFWKTSLTYEKDGTTTYGAFDDLLRDEDVYIPLDYKTRGFPPKEETTEFYIHQLDIYTLLLEHNNYKTNSVAYLVYYYPHIVGEHGNVKFHVEAKKVETDVPRAKGYIDDAIALLRGPEPESHKDCEYCYYVQYFHEFD